MVDTVHLFASLPERKVPLPPIASAKMLRTSLSTSSVMVDTRHIFPISPCAPNRMGSKARAIVKALMSCV